MKIKTGTLKDLEKMADKRFFIETKIYYSGPLVYRLLIYFRCDKSRKTFREDFDVLYSSLSDGEEYPRVDKTRRVL